MYELQQTVCLVGTALLPSLVLTADGRESQARAEEPDQSSGADTRTNVVGGSPMVAQRKHLRAKTKGEKVVRDLLARSVGRFFVEVFTGRRMESCFLAKREETISARVSNSRCC